MRRPMPRPQGSKARRERSPDQAGSSDTAKPRALESKRWILLTLPQSLSPIAANSGGKPRQEDCAGRLPGQCARQIPACAARYCKRAIRRSRASLTTEPQLRNKSITRSETAQPIRILAELDRQFQSLLWEDWGRAGLFRSGSRLRTGVDYLKFGRP